MLSQLAMVEVVAIVIVPAELAEAAVAIAPVVAKAALCLQQVVPASESASQGGQVERQGVGG